MEDQANNKKHDENMGVESETANHHIDRLNPPVKPRHRSAGMAHLISKGMRSANSRIHSAYSALNLRFRKKFERGTISPDHEGAASTRDVPSLPESGLSAPKDMGPANDAGSKKSGFLSTNIPGFDSLLSKGIPRGISVLLMGGPGCGKTTFGLHLLSEAAKKGERCLYMSFEEKESQLASHMKNYGFPVEDLIASGNLIIKRYDPFTISQSVEALLAEARGELLIKIDKVRQFIPEDFCPDIIILDSLSAVSAAFAGRKDGYRIYIEQLFRSLEETGATTFLITENSASLKKSENQVEEFLADGIISFYNLRIKNTRVKAMEILKLRGVNFKKKIVPFEITEGIGFEVYPMEEIFRKN